MIRSLRSESRQRTQWCLRRIQRIEFLAIAPPARVEADNIYCSRVSLRFSPRRIGRRGLRRVLVSSEEEYRRKLLLTRASWRRMAEQKQLDQSLRLASWEVLRSARLLSA